MTVTEYQRIERDDLGPHLVRRLQRFDERCARSGGGNVFDWSRQGFIRTLNHVGVVQVPGLNIEILPKIDRPDSETLNKRERQQRAQENLLHMLALTRNLPFRDRDLASQRLRRLPLLEVLIVQFATRLLSELRRGVHHRYRYREDNLRVVRGKLLTTQHVRANAYRQDRIYVGFDEFSSDNGLNRILKGACRRLITVCRSARAGQLLSETLLELSDVEDREIERHDFDSVHIDRSCDRFGPMLEFARLVLLGNTPSPAAGGSDTFSLIFPMDTLFEEYIGRFIQRYAHELGVSRDRVHLQAAGKRRWLLRDIADRGRFRLKPDILIRGPGGSVATIIDTKWKSLLSDDEDARNGVGQADIYQMYAYAHRYRSPHNVLLFPKIPGATAKLFRVDGDDDNRIIRIAFVDLGRDLRRDINETKADIRQIIDRSGLAGN